MKSKTNSLKPSKAPRAKSRRPRQTDYDDSRVTTFPQVKGKVVRGVRFTYNDPNSVLAIAFKDRTVLAFDIDPQPLMLPVDIRAHYVPEGQKAIKSWERLVRNSM